MFHRLFVRLRKNDLGEWVGRSSHMTASQKMEILEHCWTPSKNYNFKEDAHDPKRIFRTDWLEIYSPWLKYSKKLKGALCLYCVLFPPINVSEVLGSFIIKPYTRYKHMHKHCKNHMTNKWHQNAVKSAKNFSEELPINIKMVSGHKKIIEENRKIIYCIISNIIFCWVHGLQLRGKNSDEGNLFRLF